MSEPITTEQVGRYTVETHYDDSGAGSPRDWDNGTTLVLSHRRYDLPNEADVDFDAFGSWDEVEEHLRETHDIVAILPVRGYDHGSLHLATTSRGVFSDPWDSGQAGFIFFTREGQALVGTPDDRLDEVLAADVQVYDQWANGEVYGYTLTGPDGIEVDACWGYIGEESYALSEGRTEAEHHAFADACRWAEVPEWLQNVVLLRDEDEATIAKHLTGLVTL